MKKLADFKPVAVMGLSNTAAIVISELDAAGETVHYCVTTGISVGKVHRARVYYRASDGAPYFRSIVGRMILDNFMRY